MPAPVRRSAEERLALIPLALAGGESGSEIQAPMAAFILKRLVSSTMLNMLVVPEATWQAVPARSRVDQSFPSTGQRRLFGKEMPVLVSTLYWPRRIATSH